LNSAKAASAMAGARMSAGLLHDWANIGVLTGIFALCVVALALGEDSQLHSVVIALTVAYLISDALWILLQPDMVKTPKSIIAHHIVTVVVIADTLEFASHRVNASRALIVEANTVLLTLRRLLGRPLWCELGFYSTWVLIRLVWFPILGVSLLASTFEINLQETFLASLAPLMVQVKQPPVRTYASISFALVVGLQFYWTLAMGLGLLKKPSQKEKRGKEGGAPPVEPPASMRLPLLAALCAICIATALLYFLGVSMSSEKKVEL